MSDFIALESELREPFREAITDWLYGGCGQVLYCQSGNTKPLHREN